MSDYFEFKRENCNINCKNKSKIEIEKIEKYNKVGLTVASVNARRESNIAFNR